MCDEICHCECHKKLVMHILPCCDGKCDRCNQYIVSGQMENHKNKCNGVNKKDNGGELFNQEGSKEAGVAQQIH